MSDHYKSFEIKLKTIRHAEFQATVAANALVGELRTLASAEFRLKEETVKLVFNTHVLKLDKGIALSGLSSGSTVIVVGTERPATPPRRKFADTMSLSFKVLKGETYEHTVPSQTSLWCSALSLGLINGASTKLVHAGKVIGSGETPVGVGLREGDTVIVCTASRIAAEERLKKQEWEKRQQDEAEAAAKAQAGVVEEETYEQRQDRFFREMNQRRPEFDVIDAQYRWNLAFGGAPPEPEVVRRIAKYNFREEKTQYSDHLKALREQQNTRQSHYDRLIKTVTVLRKTVGHLEEPRVLWRGVAFEVLFNLLTYVDTTSLKRLLKVSTEFYWLIVSPQFWKEVYEREVLASVYTKDPFNTLVSLDIDEDQRNQDTQPEGGWKQGKRPRIPDNKLDTTLVANFGLQRAPPLPEVDVEGFCTTTLRYNALQDPTLSLPIILRIHWLRLFRDQLEACSLCYRKTAYPPKTIDWIPGAVVWLQGAMTEFLTAQPQPKLTPGDQKNPFGTLVRDSIIVYKSDMVLKEPRTNKSIVDANKLCYSGTRCGDLFREMIAKKNGRGLFDFSGVTTWTLMKSFPEETFGAGQTIGTSIACWKIHDLPHGKKYMEILLLHSQTKTIRETNAIAKSATQQQDKTDPDDPDNEQEKEQEEENSLDEDGERAHTCSTILFTHLEDFAVKQGLLYIVTAVPNEVQFQQWFTVCGFEPMAVQQSIGSKRRSEEREKELERHNHNSWRTSTPTKQTHVELPDVYLQYTSLQCFPFADCALRCKLLTNMW
eukprot:TRINITY_DN49243_c0_g1_i1.p1 TRINITY_DN49243_c0_g1~~TRINITY_DN49243_c0_g1_i1.p1  ORF type:complete len:771 (-),score=64.21 TRINITY_DN49243_c0_g1_i1:39-2351(-)